MFSNIVMAKLGAAGLLPSAPVPKAGPTAIKQLGEGEKLPLLGSNPYNINKELYEYVGENRFDSATTYVLTNDNKQVVGLVVGERKLGSHTVLTVVAGNGQQVDFDNKNMTINGATIDLAPFANEKGSTPLVISVLGPEKGKAVKVDVTKRSDPDRGLVIDAGAGQVDVVMGKDTGYTVVDSTGAHRAYEPIKLKQPHIPVNINIKLPKELLKTAVVDEQGPPLNSLPFQNPNRMLEGSLRIALDKENGIKAFPAGYVEDPDARYNKGLNVSVTTETTIGNRTIDLFKKGEPTQTKESLKATLPGLDAGPPASKPKDKGMER